MNGRMYAGFVFAALVVSGLGPASAQEDVADVPSKRLSLPADPNLAYFLISPTGAEVPAEGYGLLVIMPGGDGGPGFHPFVKRICKYALGGRYVAAQPIAVKWSPRQEIVWPTKNDGLAYAKVTTEQFVDEVIKSVRGQYKINPRRIFTLTWSSSGPAGYAISLQKDSPVVGSYVAMSVFRPERLGSLATAAGRAYFIDHCPQDKVCPFRMAREASRLLSAAGAKVKLNLYSGGHGWQGDVYPRIAAGVHWLEENTRPASAGAEKAPGSAPAAPASTLLHDDFEQPTEWKQGARVGGVEYLWDQKVAYQGRASMSLKKTANRYFPIAEWHRTIAFSGPKALSVSAWVKAQDAWKAVIDVKFLDATGKSLGHEWAVYIGARESNDPPANHEWKEYQGVVNVPAAARSLILALQIYGPGTVWFDALTIQPKQD
jgi:predicted esterase